MGVRETSAIKGLPRFQSCAALGYRDSVMAWFLWVEHSYPQPHKAPALQP